MVLNDLPALMAAGLSGLDYFILAFYIATVVALGSWVGKGQSSLEDYFLAGRAMPWIVVSVSIIMTDLSAISYMGVPAWVYQKDLKYVTGNVLSPLIFLLVIVIFVRTFSRMNVFTVYEYLEKRFHPIARTITAGLFLFQRGVWLAGAIYIPSVVLSTVADLPLIPCILGVGLLSTLYTVIGGMKAVIWTDFLQFVVLVGGLFVMIGVLLSEFSWDVARVWAHASQMTAAVTKTPPNTLVDFTPDLKTEATIWSVFFFYVIYLTGTTGTDQVVAQRFFTVRSFRDTAKAVLSAGFLNLFVIGLLGFLGLLIVVYYDIRPGLADTLASSDEVLPHFVVSVLPSGFRGLIIAALFAATMSSIDSALNSFATVGVMDFYRRLASSTRNTERHNFAVARLMTLICGLVATLLAVWISTRETTILETVGGLASKFIGPITGVFFLGALTKRGNLAGVFCGAATGLAVSLLVGIGPIHERVNWMWTAPLSCVATFSMGYVTSLLSTRCCAPQE